MASPANIAMKIFVLLSTRIAGKNEEYVPFI